MVVLILFNLIEACYNNEMHLSLDLISTFHLELLTLVYLVKDQQVLLLKRHPNKKVLPNVWLGLGGKVEPGESIATGAIREIQEESGLDIHVLNPRGRFVYADLDDHSGGDIHLFTSDNFSGTLITSNREGELQWHDMHTVRELSGIAKHQLFYLEEMLSNPTYEYFQTHFYRGNVRLGTIDTVPEVLQ